MIYKFTNNTLHTGHLNPSVLTVGKINSQIIFVKDPFWGYEKSKIVFIFVTEVTTISTN